MLDTRKLHQESQEFVDRKKELKVLKEHMKEVEKSNGHIVLLKGEAGVGKTVLAEKFAESCEKKGFHVLKGRCLYFESIDPYMPFLDALREHLTSERPTEGLADKTGVIAPMVHTRARSGVPMSFVGLPADDDSSGDISLSDRREMMFDKITTAVIDLANKKPVLLFIDDLQWIDGASARLLHHLTRHTRDSRVFILGAYRPEELMGKGEFPMETVLERMSEEELLEEMDIDRLSFKDTTTMIENLLNTEFLPQPFLLMLHRETEGNPYYIKEILNSMVDEGIIDPYSYDWNPEEDLSDVIIPTSIKDITTRRIERLEKAEKKVLMYASVIGTEFDFRILEEAINMDVNELLDKMDELESRGLIREKRDSMEEIFRFNHVQTRLTIYSNLGKSRKRVLHNQVADAIEKVFENDIDEQIFALSRHFYQAQEFKKSYDYSLKAGEKSLGRYAIVNAIEYFQIARKSLKRIKAENALFDEIKLVERIGELAYDVSDFTTAKGAFNDLFILSKRKKNKKLEAKAFRMLGNVSRDTQNYPDAQMYYEKSLKISADIGDKIEFADSNHGLGYIHWREGEFAKAIEHYETAVRVAEEADAKYLVALILIDMGNTYAHRGENSRAIEEYLKAIDALKEQDSWSELARAYNNIGDQYMKRYDWDKAIENFDKSIEYGKKVGNKKIMGWGYHNKAEALANKGETLEADIYSKRAEGILKKINDPVGLSMAYRVKGIINRVEGKYDKALEQMWKAVDLIKDIDIPFTKAETKFNIALIYIEKGDKEKSKEYLEEAKSTFEEIGAQHFINTIDEKLKSL